MPFLNERNAFYIPFAVTGIIMALSSAAILVICLATSAGHPVVEGTRFWSIVAFTLGCLMVLLGLLYEKMSRRGRSRL
jgi:hypothetical protein